MSPKDDAAAAAVDFTSGTLAGVAQILVGHPFDTVKVSMQIGLPGTSTGPLSTLTRIVSHQGVRGLYRGITPPMATVAAYNALLFSSMGVLHRTVRPDGGPLTAWQAAFTGALAGVPVSLLASPTELLKCRLQRQGGARPTPGAAYTLADAVAGRVLYSGAVDAARRIVQFEGGAAALFRGLMPTLAREVPGNAAYFGFYTLMKQQLAARQGLDSPSYLGAGSLMTAGAVAGASYWAFTIPFDVIKSRIQTDNPLDTQRRYRGMLDCGRALVRSQGWGGLFRGWQPCMARSIPANAATFLAYELASRTLTSAAGLAPKR